MELYMRRGQILVVDLKLRQTKVNHHRNVTELHLVINEPFPEDFRPTHSVQPAHSEKLTRVLKYLITDNFRKGKFQ